MILTHNKIEIKTMFNENSKLSEIIRTEKGREILERYGVPCLSCAMFSSEADQLKIGEVADIYKLDKDAILKELNEQ